MFHHFQTYTWPGPLGWIARDTPGNLAASAIAFFAGYMWKGRQVIKKFHGRLDDLHERHDAHEAVLDDQTKILEEIRSALEGPEKELKLISHSMVEVLDALHFPPPAPPAA